MSIRKSPGRANTPAHEKALAAPADPDPRACVFGLRALEPGFGRFVFAPRPTALEWARTTVATSHGDIVASWRLADGVFEASLTVPQGTAALVLIPIAALGHSEIRVNGRRLWPATEQVGGVSPGQEDRGRVAFHVEGGQTYHFQSQ